MPKRKNAESAAPKRKTRTASKKEEELKEETDILAPSPASAVSTPTQSPKPSGPSAPISAIAARRAALALSTNNEQQQDTDNDIDQQMEKSQITDWDSEDEEFAEESDAETGNVNRGTSVDGTMIKKPKIEKSKPAQYDPKAISKFSPSPANTVVITPKSSDEILIVGLRKDEHIVFQGQALIAPILGSFTALGALFGQGQSVPSNFRDFECPDTLHFSPIFSPKTHSLVCIEPDASKSAQSHYEKAMVQKLPFPIKKQLQNSLLAFQNANGKLSTVLAIKSLTKTGIADIEQVLPLFKSVFTVEDAKIESEEPAVQAINSIHGFCPVLQPTPNVKVMQLPPSWNSGVNQFISSSQTNEDAQIALICGSKRMGKSTFSRYLVNRLLEKHGKVAFLEADVGQPEFGVQGIISLHVLVKPLLGPPFANSHLQAKRSFFIGSTSPRDDPDHYMACLMQLLQEWRKEYGVEANQANLNSSTDVSPVPLVINTHGWIKGLGYDLLIDLIHAASPNMIFAFQSTVTTSRNLPPSFLSSVVPVGQGIAPPKISYLTSLMDDQDADFTAQRYHPSDHRMLNLISYMHANTNRTETNMWWDFKKRLVERTPWCLDWTVGLKGIWVLFEEIKYSQLLYALNGSIVALIGDANHGALEQSMPDSRQTNSSAVAPPPFFTSSQSPHPDPSATHCFGLGIIRTIDPANQRFLILTPLPFDTLKKVNGVVKGDLELPIWAMLDNRSGGGGGIAGVPWRKVPYVSFDANEGIGNSALRIRRNVMRKGQNTK
ncbi:hypothetical protein INT43_006660 [Umbelopsis isabellina]|uniref:Polynucleotide 5'-hydroxyl-kinase GRC3 n=1 Tax=Mortierella isabellina TaxID=91625 RepID=A0A8H7UJ50_MORIS|nr:hypothetical protein INT43_006660 [Umbelopsis isabellina]